MTLYILIPVYTGIYYTVHRYTSLCSPIRRHSIGYSIYVYIDIIQPHTSQRSPKRHYTAHYQFIWPYTTLYSPIPVYTAL